jgi:hypothetical protein
MTDYTVSETHLSLYEMNGNKHSEEAMRILAVLSLTMFFAYYVYRLFMFNAIKEDEIMNGVRVLERVTKYVNSQQEDIQQDLMILQDRISQYSELEEEVRALQQKLMMLTTPTKIS